MGKPWYKKDAVVAAIAGSGVAGVFTLAGIVVQAANQPDTAKQSLNCYTVEEQILTIYKADPNIVLPSTNLELIESCDINRFIEQLQKDRPAIEAPK